LIEDIFALSLLYCDGYLAFKEMTDVRKHQGTKRFFHILGKLPLDIKMILIRRIFFSPKIFFLSNQTEDALKRILSSPFY